MSETLPEVERRALRAAYEYAKAYRNWHQGKDYSQASMLRFRATREAFLSAITVMEAVDEA